MECKTTDHRRAIVAGFRWLHASGVSAITRYRWHKTNGEFEAIGEFGSCLSLPPPGQAGRKARFVLFGLCLCLAIAIGCGQDNRTAQTESYQRIDPNVIDPAPRQTAGQPATPPAAPNRKVRLKIDVSGFENNEGNCRIAVYLNQAHFNDAEYAIAKESVRIAESKADWQVDLEIPVSSGSDATTFNRLAVSAFHDANTNKRLDKNAFGIPTERYGFSKDPKRGFGPPKFIETALELELPDSPSDSSVVVEVPIQIK